MNCWINPKRKCDEVCAAFLRLDAARTEFSRPAHGVPLFSDPNGEIRTYCAIIASFWELGESINRLARDMKPR
mgnify:CR=1 FL=1